METINDLKNERDLLQRKINRLQSRNNELASWILRQLRMEAEQLGFPDLARYIKFEEVKIRKKDNGSKCSKK